MRALTTDDVRDEALGTLGNFLGGYSEPAPDLPQHQITLMTPEGEGPSSLRVGCRPADGSGPRQLFKVTVVVEALGQEP